MKQLLLKVDACYAFDYLSILEVKKDIKKESSIYSDNWQDCFNFIQNQFQEKKDLFNKIINSKEYKELYEANLRTFNFVDLAKNDNVLASVVDQSNYERYIKKTNLQKKFFGLDKMSELKINYKK